VVTVTLIVALTLIIFFFPVSVSQAIGVFGLVALYTFCLVAFCIHFSLLTIKRNFPCIPTALAAALLISFLDLNDNDAVRALTHKEAVEAPYDDTRSAADQFVAWYENHAAEMANYDEYPVYIVAAEGGGIYAAAQRAMWSVFQQRCSRLHARHRCSVDLQCSGARRCNRLGRRSLILVEVFNNLRSEGCDRLVTGRGLAAGLAETIQVDYLLQVLNVAL
jgi:hypothetical protein